MKAKDYLLHLNHLRKFVGYETFYRAINTGFKLDILDKPISGKALVLSPHPDDDAFGCGGTISLHRKVGCEVKVIYLHDGSGGGEKDVREAEARNSADILGTHDLEFWQIADKQELKTPKDIKRLSDVINTFDPAVIYVPSFLDPHPDHCEVAELLAYALKSTNFSGMIFSYEIWSPIFANRLIKIDEVIDLKKQAIDAHGSQLTERGYKEAIVGLAQYRAGMFNAGKYAEAFFACDGKTYQKLFKLTSG